jgi:hypothetical protein
MLLYREAPPQYIAKLRAGDFFENSTITEIVKNNERLRIVTATGDVYSVHPTLSGGFKVFHQRKDLKDMRRAREAAKKAAATPPAKPPATPAD